VITADQVVTLLVTSLAAGLGLGVFIEYARGK
jgi:hypothetical protein